MSMCSLDVNFGRCDVYVLAGSKLWEMRCLRGLSKKYPTIFFPAVSNRDRVGKLSVVVVGT
jgi:hypothetical protein